MSWNLDEDELDSCSWGRHRKKNLLPEATCKDLGRLDVSFRTEGLVCVSGSVHVTFT